MKKKKREIKKLYTLPGELIYTGNKTSIETSVEQINYSKNTFTKSTTLNLKQNENNFVLIKGLNDLKMIKSLGEKIKIHRLILEDILNTSQNIKVSIYEEKVFITIKDFHFDKTNKNLTYEQISFLLVNNYLYLFLEEENKLVNMIKERIEEEKGIVREKNLQYLIFAVLDLFIDSYVQIASEIEEEILEFEEKINREPEGVEVKEILTLKKSVVSLKKDSLYLKEMLKKLLSDNIGFDKENKIYFEDILDKATKIYDYSEDCKEDINALINYHMTQLSNNMNKIMKVLTFISTIFIPLSFLAGLYGMNFAYMPELQYRYSYPILLLIMILLVLLMVRFFKKRKWF